MKMDLETARYFVKEREAIRERREAGLPRPWTDNSILRGNKFCNVRRENDAVTKWIATNWRGPHADHPDVAFAMAVARFVNWPDSLAELGFPAPWTPDHFKRVLRARAAGDEKVFGGAYIVGNGGEEKPKIEYIADNVLTPLWRYRDYWRPKRGDKLATIAVKLRQFEGLAGFMTGQIIADIKYVEPLRSASDWTTFVAAGPGSKAGLARLIGRPADYEWGTYPGWLPTFREFESAMRPWLVSVGLGDLHSQDLQNVLCELSKYLRIRDGGRSKRRYCPPPMADAAE